jgi:hypothetical protein
MCALDLYSAFQAALGTESRVCYPSNTADRQPQLALMSCYLSQSTANQNERLILCHHWDLNLYLVVNRKTRIDKTSLFFQVFPLHGQLQADEQQKVFEPLEQNKRKVVFATNCAETSITIDGIKYFILCNNNNIMIIRLLYTRDFPKKGLKTLKNDNIVSLMASAQDSLCLSVHLSFRGVI